MLAIKMFGHRDWYEYKTVLINSTVDITRQNVNECMSVCMCTLFAVIHSFIISLLVPPTEMHSKNRRALYALEVVMHSFIHSFSYDQKSFSSLPQVLL